MPTSEGGYTMLWIPASGLFYRGGDFFDGKLQPIGWDHTIRVYPTFSDAEADKKQTLARFPDAQGAGDGRDSRSSTLWYVVTPDSIPGDGARVLYRRKRKGFWVEVVQPMQGGQGFPAWRGAIGYIPADEWETAA